MIYDDDIKVHPITDVRGKNFDVYVSSGGIFKTEFKGKEFTAKDPEELRRKLMVATKQAATPIDVPFDVLVGDKVKRGHCTGQHSSNGNYLIRWDDGRTSQERTFYRTMRPLTPEEKAEWVTLNKAHIEAGLTLHAFERQHAIAVGNEVYAALQKAGRDA